MLQSLSALNLDGHDNFIVRHLGIVVPIGDAEPVGAESAADTALELAAIALKRAFRSS